MKQHSLFFKNFADAEEKPGELEILLSDELFDLFQAYNSDTDTIEVRFFTGRSMGLFEQRILAQGTCSYTFNCSGY